MWRSRKWVVLGLMLGPVFGACESTSDDPENGAPVAGEAGEGGGAGEAGSQGGSGNGAVGGGAGETLLGGEAGVAGAAGAAACSPDEPSYVSGQRLRARYAVTTEGNREFLGWYDTERKEDCAVGTAPDGKLRCLPEMSRLALTPRFIDDQCQEPVTLHVHSSESKECEAKYLLSPPASSCEGGTTLRERGAATEPPPLHHQSGASCSPDVGRFEAYYELGPDVLPSAFAEVSSRAVCVGERLQRLVYETEDGMRQPYGWLDTAGERNCDFGLAEDGLLRCLPSAALTQSPTAFASCEAAPLYVNDTCEAETPNVIRIPSDEACPSSSRFVSRGPGPKEAYIFMEETGEGCVETSKAGLYTLGAEIAADYFVEGRAAIAEDDSGRLKPIVRSNSDGGQWSDGFYDSQLETNCKFMPMKDGALHCVPWLAHEEVLVPDGYPLIPDRRVSSLFLEIEEFFTDELCMTKANLGARFACDGGDARSYALSEARLVDGPEDCQTEIVVRPVDDVRPPTELPSLWYMRGSQCAAHTPSSIYEYVELGAELEPSELVSAEVEVE